MAATVFGICALWPTGSHAQTVLSCASPWGASSGCGGCSGLQWADRAGDPAVYSPQRSHWTKFSALLPSDEVFVSDAAPGAAQCDTSRRRTVSSLAAPAAPTAAALKPYGWPMLGRVKILEVPADIRGAHRLLAVWSNESPTLTSTSWLTFNWDEALPWAIGALTDANAEWARNPATVEPPAVQAWAIARRDEYGWRAVTAANGTSTTRPVYSKDANGLRVTTAVAGQRVAVGATCWGTRLADSAGKATKYHSVQGHLNLATADPVDRLGDVYALCTVTSPAIGVN